MNTKKSEKINLTEEQLKVVTAAGDGHSCERISDEKLCKRNESCQWVWKVKDEGGDCLEK